MLFMTVNSRPLVSIYIPTQNRCELLKRAIDSVLKQTYENIEILICDDGSTDGTEDFVKFLCAKYVNIVYLKNRTPMGACAARNLCIQAAKGEYITGLDDDDFFEQERISFFVAAWNDKNREKKMAGLFDSVKVITPMGSITRHTVDNVFYQDLRKCNILGNQVFAPREHYIEAGLFDPTMPAWQDWDLWLRMSEKFGEFININRFSYTVDECHDFGRITAKNENKIRQAKNKFMEKLGKVSINEHAFLLASLHAYPQVKPKINELIILLVAGKVLTLLLLTRRMLKKYLF